MRRFLHLGIIAIVAVILFAVALLVVTIVTVNYVLWYTERIIAYLYRLLWRIVRHSATRV